MSRRLRFLHLTTFYPPYSFGGDGVFVHRLCRALAEAGHHVDVAHDVDAYRLLHRAPPEMTIAEHPGVRRLELHSRWGRASPLVTQQTGRPLLVRRQLSEIMERGAYDVIHHHNVSLLGPDVLRMARANPEAITLYTTHEHWLICPMHVLWKFDERPCERPQCLACVLKGGRPPQLWRSTGLLRKAIAQVDQLIAPSRFTARMHAERGITQPMAHLPHFVDRIGDDRDDGDDGDDGGGERADGRRGEQHRPHDRPYFLFAGRLERIKGLHTLVALWPRVTGADLLVAGTGALEGELRAAAAANPAVVFLGGLPPDGMGALYAHAIAVIVPSVGYETFGMVSIEAFARATPVVVRNLGALPEVVEESGGGFVYDTDEQLLAFIERLQTSPRLRDELGAKGHKAFLERWTPEAHLRNYLSLVGEVSMRTHGTDVTRATSSPQ
jgi:glycosyltransferase involved in cell wall biosynthesis